jgi:hypothetical protein
MNFVLIINTIWERGRQTIWTDGGEDLRRRPPEVAYNERD